MCDGDDSPGARSGPDKERIRESVHAQIESLGRILLELSNSGRVFSVLHCRPQCIEEFGAKPTSLRDCRQFPDACDMLALDPSAR